MFRIRIHFNFNMDIGVWNTNIAETVFALFKQYLLKQSFKILWPNTIHPVFQPTNSLLHLANYIYRRVIIVAGTKETPVRTQTDMELITIKLTSKGEQWCALKSRLIFQRSPTWRAEFCEPKQYKTIAIINMVVCSFVILAEAWLKQIFRISDYAQKRVHCVSCLCCGAY